MICFIFSFISWSVLFEVLNISLHDTTLKKNIWFYLLFVGNFEEAKEYFTDAITICKKTNDFTSLGMSYRGLGLMYLDQGEWKNAVKEFSNANKYHQKAEHTTAFEATTVFLGMTYFFDEEYDKAKEYID